MVVLFYGIIAIHDIPYLIAKSRQHPHQDAIHAAGWVSLFTLHAIWPFLWIWAMLYRPRRGWGFADSASEPEGDAPQADAAPLVPLTPDEVEGLRLRITQIEGKLGIGAR